MSRRGKQHHTEEAAPTETRRWESSTTRKEEEEGSGGGRSSPQGERRTSQARATTTKGMEAIQKVKETHGVLRQLSASGLLPKHGMGHLWAHGFSEMGLFFFWFGLLLVVKKIEGAKIR